jgi:hypothetical protein
MTIESNNNLEFGTNGILCCYKEHVRLSLSAESINYSAMFFSPNKLVNSSHGFLGQKL